MTWKQIGRLCRAMLNRPAQNTRARNSAYQIITTIETIVARSCVRE
jgi:hypothetical protein